MASKQLSGSEGRRRRKLLGNWSEESQEAYRCRDNKRCMDRKRKKTEFITQTKMKAGCTDCGYKAHPAALHFDHLPGFDKVAGLSVMKLTHNIKQITAEMAKCEVVCANCHAIRTFNRKASAPRKPKVEDFPLFRQDDQDDELTN